MAEPLAAADPSVAANECARQARRAADWPSGGVGAGCWARCSSGLFGRWHDVLWNTIMFPHT